MENKSIHPFDPFVPMGATKLIIGTIPPYRFCHNKLENDDVNFYYVSKDNYFWELISEVTNEKLSFENSEKAVQERKNLLSKLKIGITDIVSSCVHKDKKSDDKSLLEIELKDIRTLLENNQNIDTLIYTSRFVSSLVNKIADKSYHSWVNKRSKNGEILFLGKKYNVIVLYSPSPSARRKVTRETVLCEYSEIFKGNNE